MQHRSHGPGAVAPMVHQTNNRTKETHMDPEATLRQLDELAAIPWTAREYSEALDLAADLAGWLDRGGFAPTWSQYPQGAAAYRMLRLGLMLEPAEEIA